ncbi:MAG: trigger factor [Magnetococcus sp. WYHC-3]
MEVTVEEKGTYERALTVRIPAAEVDPVLEEAFRELSRSARLPGFRPGKTPRRVLESRYGAALAADVAEKLIQNSFGNALQSQQLNPVGPPLGLESGSVSRGQDFSYTATIQVFPRIEPKGYQGMALTRTSVSIDDADVDKVVERIRRSHAQFVAEEGRAAQQGDQLVLDFKGTLDGHAFPGGEAENYVLNLGESRFIPGFEEQLMGVRPGESRDLHLTFPEGYHAAHLAGQAVQFQCRIHEVRRGELPAADDDLATKAGVTAGGMERLRSDIRQRLQDDGDQTAREQLRQQILRGLLDANPMELPSQLVDMELDAMVKRIVEDYKKQGTTLEQSGQTPEGLQQQYRGKAHERVVLGLLMGSITRTENIVVTEAAIEAHLDRITAQYGESAGNIKNWFRNDEKRMEDIRGTLLEEAVMDWIVDHGQVTGRSVGLEALLAGADQVA